MKIIKKIGVLLCGLVFTVAMGLLLTTLPEKNMIAKAEESYHKTYALGANKKIQENEFYMVPGASVRLGDPTGLGFISRIDYTLYNSLIGEYANVKLGTLILPYDKLVGEVTHANLNASRIVYLDVANDYGFRNEATAAKVGYYEYRGSIVNLYQQNYSRKFAAVGYICLDGQYYYTPFDEEDHVRSARDVAYAAYNDVEESNTTGEHTNLITNVENQHYGKYSPYTDSQLNIIEGYARLFNDSNLIVYDSQTDHTAAKMLKEYLGLATGETFTIEPSTSCLWDSSNTIISIGQTFLLEDIGYGTLANNTVSGDGYIRRVVNNTLFIDGVNERGSIYGVLDYLEEAYGFVFVDDECYTYTSGHEINITPSLNKDFTPTFEIRSYLGYGTSNAYTNAQTAIYQKNNSYMLIEDMTSLGGTVQTAYVTNRDHNMYETLCRGIDIYNAVNGTNYSSTSFAEEFYVGEELNYNPCLSGGLTQDGLKAVDFMTLAMKELILNTYPSGVRYYSLSQEDTMGEQYCTCATCTSDASSYNRSGLMLRFFDTLITNLENDAEISALGDDWKIMTFAYQYTLDSPVNTSCNDKIIIRLAYGADNAYKGIANNSADGNYLDLWSNCGVKEFMYWGYDISFVSYVPYFASINGSMADNIKYLKDHNITFVMFQGAYNADNIWHSQLRAWVYGKLMYDFDEAAYAAGADAYVQSLVTQYLNAYYGQYASAVQDVITYYQEEYKNVVIWSMGEGWDDLSRTKHNTARKKLDSAISSCTDETILQRLYAVRASCSAAMWEKDSWPYATQDEKSFASDAEMGEIRRWSELLNIEDVTSYYTPPVEDEDPPSIEGEGDAPYVSDDDYGLNDIY